MRRVVVELSFVLCNSGVVLYSSSLANIKLNVVSQIFFLVFFLDFSLFFPGFNTYTYYTTLLTTQHTNYTFTM